jgi:peptide deformylase
MAIRKIAQLGEPVLRQQARPLTREELLSIETQRFIEDMIDTMRDADGAGLAAPQVYESVQLVVIELASARRYPDVERIPLLVLANPVLTPLVGQDGVLADPDAITVYEGCLSVRMGGVSRGGRAARGGSPAGHALHRSRVAEEPHVLARI